MDPNAITVRLSLTDWQAVVNLLAEQPYKLSAPLIQQIASQVQPPAGGQPGQPAMLNGEAAELRQ